MRFLRLYFAVVLIAISTLSMSAQRFRIFAYDGEDYTVYLGNFTDSFDSNSIWNSFGTYGNEFSSESIWNEFSEYGNEFNPYSPWNEYSSYPPVIVDDEWNIVDYFSCSYMASDRMRKLMEFIKENFDDIASDPSSFYDNYLDR